MRLLCQFHSNRVLEKLIAYNFPRDGVLDILQKHDIYDAILYIRYQLGYTHECLKESQQLIMRGMSSYLESNDQSKSFKAISQAYFGFEIYCKIVEETKSAEDEAVKPGEEKPVMMDQLPESLELVIKLLKDLIEYYVKLIKTHVDANNKAKAKVFYLMDFIFHGMVDELILKAASAEGFTEVLNMVTQGDLQDVRASEIANLIKQSQVICLQMRYTKEGLKATDYDQEADFFRRAVCLVYFRLSGHFTVTRA